MSQKRVVALVKLVAAVLLIAGGFWFARQSEFGRRYLTLESTRGWVEAQRPYDRVVYVLGYTVGALFLPGTLLSFVGAVLYGTVQGTFLTWIGATLGSTAPFLIARLLGRPAVESFLGDQNEAIGKLDRWIAAGGFRGVFWVRLLPIFPYSLVNYGSGLTAISLRDYLLGTALGILPGVFFYQYLFANVGQEILTNGLHWKQLLDPNLLAPMAAFVTFGLTANYFAQRMNRAKGSDAQKPTQG